VVASLASAAPISTLRNTGLAPAGSADLAWGVNYGPAYVTNSWPIGVWNSTGSDSAWISPQPVYRLPGLAPFTGETAGEYVFTTSFEIPVGFDPLSASFTFRALADNQLTGVRLNSTLFGPSFSFIDLFVGGIPQGRPYKEWSPTYTVDNGFVSGWNTLSFIVTNYPKLGASSDDVAGNPAGLRVEFLESNMEEGDDPDPVPEPASMLLLGTGLLGAVRAARKRR
jgi:hypothetical protein